MKKCPNCKREIESDSIYCEYCGKKLKSSKWPLVIMIFVLAITVTSIMLKLFEKRGTSMLSLSLHELYYDASGGTKTIDITTNNGNWEVGTGMVSWGHLSKEGNVLKVRIDPNTETSSRSDWFEIKAGDLTERVDVTQGASERTLLLSSHELCYDASGGTKTINITTNNGNWEVGTGMVSWGHLSKDGNVLKVRIDPNTETSSRSDWFEIKAGDLMERVNVTQGASEITLSLSTCDLSFGSDGGTQTINVTTNGLWSIGTDTYSWGHLTKDGNCLRVKIDPNTDSDARTDYFTIKAGDQEISVNITQSAAVISWGISGTSREYTDVADALNYITDQIHEMGKCRLGAITEYGKGVVIFGDNGAAWSSIPDDLSEKIREISQKISSVTLTNSGYYCVIYGKNGWFGRVSEGMKNKLNEYNNNHEEICSVSISENGHFAIVTDEHFSASNSSDLSNMKLALELYGSIKNVCITNRGICLVCQNGIYYNNIPSNLETKLKSLDVHPDHIVFTDSGTYLITTESGLYSYKL